jgi:hypothetical protein
MAFEGMIAPSRIPLAAVLRNLHYFYRQIAVSVTAFSRPLVGA